jgi:hypothetical protein
LLFRGHRHPLQFKGPVRRCTCKASRRAPRSCLCLPRHAIRISWSAHSPAAACARRCASASWARSSSFSRRVSAPAARAWPHAMVSDLMARSRWSSSCFTTSKDSMSVEGWSVVWARVCFGRSRSLEDAAVYLDLIDQCFITHTWSLQLNPRPLEVEPPFFQTHAVRPAAAVARHHRRCRRPAEHSAVVLSAGQCARQ